MTQACTDCSDFCKLIVTCQFLSPNMVIRWLHSFPIWIKIKIDLLQLTSHSILLENKTQMINAAGIRFSFNKTKVISLKLHRRRKVFGYHSDFTNQLGW